MWWTHWGPHMPHFCQAELQVSCHFPELIFSCQGNFRANCSHFSSILFSWTRFWTSQSEVQNRRKFWVVISGNSLVPRKTEFFPILVLIEITCHSLLPLIQGSVLNWAIDLESSFLYKTIQQERHSKERWGLKGLEPYLTHFPFLIVKNSTEKLQNQCQPHISGDRGNAIQQQVEAPSFYRGSPAPILCALTGPHRCFIVEV